MRQLTRAVCACFGFCMLVAAAGPAYSSNLGFSIDVVAPTTPCSNGNCPSDTNLPLLGESEVGGTNFAYSSVGSNFIANATFDSTVTTPIVCDQNVAASTIFRFSPIYYNNNDQADGDLLEFGAGGPNVVDLSQFDYASLAPPVIGLTRINTSGSQVACYPINPVGTDNMVSAAGTTSGDRVFLGTFGGHSPNEAWVSVQTVNSPSASGGTQMAYVVQIHNADKWLNPAGRVGFGYDTLFFDPANNFQQAPTWCVLQPNTQPGSLGSCKSGPFSVNNPSFTNYTLASGDVNATTHSIYLKVMMTGSTLAQNSWASMGTGFYPATAEVFSGLDVYPTRLDDKVAVASSNNVPTQNIANINCDNNLTSTSCTLTDSDNHAVSPLVTFANHVASGTVVVDPIAYFIDPVAGTNVPSNATIDALNVNVLSCSDPSGILLTPIGNASFATSTGTPLGGALALGFTFAPSGLPDFPYKGGTAVCTATFSTTGYAPSLSSAQSFSITMKQASVGSVALTSSSVGPVNQGGTVNYTMTVTNAGNSALQNVVATDTLGAGLSSVVWNSTCTPIGNGVCPTPLASGSSQTIPSLPGNGDGVQFSLTAMVGSITNPALAAVLNSASISVPGGSCSGGACATPAVSVPTVPIVGITMQGSEPQYHTNDNITYTVGLTNFGGTPATGITLTDFYPSGLTFNSWTCTPSGANSVCPNSSGGSGNVNENPISIDAGGNVSYLISASVQSTGGQIINTGAAVLANGAVCATSGACSASWSMTLGP